MERHMVRVASYTVLLRDGKVYLGRRVNTGWMDGMYGLPSGHMESGESPSLAAAREAKEEAGVDISPADLKCVFVAHRLPGTPGDFEYVDFFFTADKWAGEPSITEPELSDQAGWFPLSGLPENTIPYIKEVLLGIRDGKIYLEK